MAIAIHRNVFGSKKHLVIDSDGSSRWCNDVNATTWLYGGDTQRLLNFNALLDVNNIDVSRVVPEQYVKAWEHASANSSVEPEWGKILPGKMYLERWKRVVSEIIEASSVIEDDYTPVYVKCRKFIGSLVRSKVDNEKVERLICDTQNHSLRENLSRFVSRNDDFCDRSIYNQAGTVTGRLTVKSGPNILTLKKDHRSILRSRHRDGALFMIDLVSLEPRICGLISGYSPPEDIYGYFNEAFCPTMTREDAKMSIIGTLYGMSPRSLSRKIKCDTSARQVMTLVRNYLNTSKIVNNIEDDHREHGYVKNYFGRKIFTDEPILNHYIQSTGVDVSILCFDKIVENLRDIGVNVDPTFIIHDAVILDVDAEGIDKIESFCEHPVEIDELAGSFYVKCERLC